MTVIYQGNLMCPFCLLKAVFPKLYHLDLPLYDFALAMYRLYCFSVTVLFFPCSQAIIP